MNIHEYQAKMVLRKYKIPMSEFAVISRIDQLEKVIQEFNLDQAVIKAQVHAGGRGKAGAVKFAKNRQEIYEYTKQILGMKMVNRQTGPSGVIVNQVLLSAPINIKREFYVGATIDRLNAQAVLIVSPEGGADIEELAVSHPEKILTLPIDPSGTLKHFRLLHVAKFMGWEGQIAKEGMEIISGLCKAFMDNDASLLEINPLVETEDSHLLALDAKLSVDENALFRQKAIAEFYDPTQLSEYEAQAKVYDLAYVALDGNIGCMVNGAGLAMATMDIIKHYGGKPANFLDVGGGASQEKVTEGFKLILSDHKVKAILVNIFGGIMNCATMAGGIIAAAGELKIHVPLVIRLEGTNVEQGKKMLKDSGLDLIVADGLAEAAQKAVAAAK